MAEGQSRHRQELEKQVVGSNCASEKRGMIFGFLICLVALSAGTFLAFRGKSDAGIASIVGALAAPAAVFIIGKQKQQKDLQARQRGIIEAARRTQP